MKKILAFVLCCTALVLISCEQNGPILGKVVTLEATAITDYSAKLKSRHIALPTKVYTVKAVVCLVVMYECES